VDGIGFRQNSAEGLVIFEILLLLLLAVIVIPPEKLPEAMRAAGKVLRELRLASNTVVRELTSALDEPYTPPVRTPMTRPAMTALPSTAAGPPVSAAASVPATPPASADAPSDVPAAPNGPETQK
jgi:Sec-independent protein translocase protein TatA